MNLQLIKAIVVLPGSALVYGPGAILWFVAESGAATAPAGAAQPRFWFALILGTSGLAVVVWTTSLFRAVGEGAHPRRGHEGVERARVVLTAHLRGTDTPGRRHRPGPVVPGFQSDDRLGGVPPFGPRCAVRAIDTSPARSAGRRCGLPCLHMVPGSPRTPGSNHAPVESWMTPGRMSSLSTAVARQAPRSLNTRTASPAATPRAAASAGCVATGSRPSSFPARPAGASIRRCWWVRCRSRAAFSMGLYRTTRRCR